MDLQLPWLRAPKRLDGEPSRGVLIVAAHPDDEVIGAASCIASAIETWVVHVTDGAPRDLRDAIARGFEDSPSYAEARAAEAEEALALAGMASDRLVRLGCPDQEAAFHLAALAGQLCEVMMRIQPELVITHSYEGGHPDHDSTCFAVQAAWRMLDLDSTPTLLEMTSYHLREDMMVTGHFLAGAPRGMERRVVLEPRQRDLKRRMLACHRTQAEVLRNFGTEEERYRPALPYDFGAPPHAGRLFYEQFPWGIDGHEWRRRAREAATDLNLPPTLCA